MEVFHVEQMSRVLTPGFFVGTNMHTWPVTTSGQAAPNAERFCESEAGWGHLRSTSAARKLTQNR